MSPAAPVAGPVVLAAPSGSGKTTLARALVEGPGRFAFSVSATTRPRRAGERDGVDYHFVDAETFQAMVEAGELVEWAEVHGHLYGTPRRELEEAARRGRRVVLDIDVQGARIVRERVPGAVLVFVLPPSIDALLDRIARRGTEDGAGVARRLRTAERELDAAREFDRAVVNDDLGRCLEELRTIVRAEDLRPSRIPDLEERVAGLKADVRALLAGEYAGADDDAGAGANANRRTGTTRTTRTTS